ncbi:aspartate kinase [bacterium]|nr:aspartate kinase [bacterium]
MDIIIQKYGGSSVADTQRLKTVAKRVIDAYRSGKHVVVVVSAMANTTDDLIELAKQVTKRPRERELDMLMTAGERISMALLSMIIWQEGLQAISFTGSQSGIITDNNHTRAKIIEVKAFRIIEELHRNRIVIVAGFQGVSGEREVTTLGRGGSDTTAVALAATLGATTCEICTDVDGVYTLDPKIEPKARKLREISYEAMLDLAVLGAKVIHSRAVELARIKNIPLEIRSSFENKEGTIVKGEDEIMETPEITAVSYRENIVFYKLNFEEKQDFNEFLEQVNGNRIVLEQLHTHEDNGKLLVCFWISDDDQKRFVPIAEKYGADADGEAGIVGIVGHEINQNTALIHRVFGLLNDRNYEVKRFYSTNTSISLMVKKGETEKISKYLHQELIG